MNVHQPTAHQSSTSSMPFKFICEHCDQVLKASSKKVGLRAKCPKCKSTIKVPDEKEAAARVAKFKASQKPNKNQPDPFSEFQVFDVDSEIVYETERPSTSTSTNVSVDRSKVAVPRTILYMQGALLGISALVFFTLGLIFGQAIQSDSGGTPQAQMPCIVSGRVEYRDESGQRRHDGGAVVIIVPKGTRADPQAEPIGLRPEDELPDEDNEALWTIKDLGGAYGRTNEQGEFRLQVRNQSSYYILCISNHAYRDDHDQLTNQQRAQMGNYFLPVDDLIGRNQFNWQVANIASVEHRDLNDIVFE